MSQSWPSGAASAKATAVPRKGPSRGGQQGRETPLQEVAAEPLAAAGGEASVEIAGQADFEQPQQVGTKQQGHRHHEADETGALELDPQPTAP